MTAGSPKLNPDPQSEWAPILKPKLDGGEPDPEPEAGGRQPETEAMTAGSLKLNPDPQRERAPT